MPKKRSEKPKKEKPKFPPIEIDFDELLYLNSWPVKTAIYGLFRKGDVVETFDGVGTKKTIRELFRKVLDLFLDKWNLDNGTAIRQFIHIEKRDMKKKDACRFLKASIFPYMEAKKYQPNEKMVELVEKVLGQTEATPTEESDPAKPIPKPQKKNKRHEESNKHIPLILAAAKKRWKEDPAITIKNMGYEDEILNASNGKIYSDEFYRKHLKDLAPDNTPGRRPKKN